MEFADLSSIKEGLRYIIDAEFNNSTEIEVVKVYGKNFCRVREVSSGDEWDTMKYRLSRLPVKEDPHAQHGVTA